MRSKVNRYHCDSGKYKKQLSLPKGSNVIFTNEVKDIIPFMSATDVCIAPLILGSGVKLKILTYLSFGKPVISTPIGVEGIKVKNGDEVIISEIEGFDKEIEKLAFDPDLRMRIGQNGRRLVKEIYNKYSVARKLTTILDAVIH